MISICLPTRGRPERFADMYASALASAHGAIEVIAVLDDDDETFEDYPPGPTYIFVEGRKQSDLWNVAWEQASGDIAHMGSDDLIYRTPGWDTAVEHAFARWRDKIGMVYVNDLNPVSPRPFHGMKPSENVSLDERGKPRYVFACNPFVSRRWIEAAGFFTPPYYESWESDTWLYQVADSISRAKYLHDIVIEHMHPMIGKAEMDATYEKGAWVDRRLRTKMNNLTKSARMRIVRKEQVEALTAAIQAGR